MPAQWPFWRIHNETKSVFGWSKIFTKKSDAEAAHKRRAARADPSKILLVEFAMEATPTGDAEVQTAVNGHGHVVYRRVRAIKT